MELFKYLKLTVSKQVFKVQSNSNFKGPAAQHKN